MAKRSRPRGALAATTAATFALALTAGMLLLPSHAAQAAPVSALHNGMTFSADDADPSEGAAVTGYDQSFGSSVDIPGAVSINGTEYAVTSVGPSAFEQKGLETVTLPDSVTTIGDSAFRDNAITSIALPPNLTTLDDFAFFINQLETVTIPAHLPAIGFAAFGFSPLTEVWFAGMTAPEMQNAGQFGPFGEGYGLTLKYHCDATGFSYPAWQKYDTSAVCTVSFDSAGGSPVPPATTTVGETVAEPADPSREGFTFSGWFVDAATTSPFDFATTVPTSMTLYAGWVAKTYPVTFDSAGGTAVSPERVQHGGTLTAPTEPTRDGHAFTGWFTDATLSEKYDFATPVTGAFTLTAGWNETTTPVVPTPPVIDTETPAPPAATPPPPQGPTLQLADSGSAAPGFAGSLAGLALLAGTALLTRRVFQP